MRKEKKLNNIELKDKLSELEVLRSRARLDIESKETEIDSFEDEIDDIEEKLRTKTLREHLESDMKEPWSAVEYCTIDNEKLNELKEWSRDYLYRYGYDEDGQSNFHVFTKYRVYFVTVGHYEYETTVVLGSAPRNPP